MTQEEMFSSVCNEQIISIRIEHQNKMQTLIEQHEMNLFTMLKPKVQIYKDKWQVIYNNEIFGEGETLMKAIYDFNKQFNKKPNEL